MTYMYTSGACTNAARTRATESHMRGPEHSAVTRNVGPQHRTTVAGAPTEGDLGGMRQNASERRWATHEVMEGSRGCGRRRGLYTKQAKGLWEDEDRCIGMGEEVATMLLPSAVMH